MVSVSDARTEYVSLADGLIVRLSALMLLWGLEERGCTIRREPDGALFVGPSGLITDAERAAIRFHRDELLTLLAYVDSIQ